VIFLRGALLVLLLPCLLFAADSQPAPPAIKSSRPAPKSEFLPEVAKGGALVEYSIGDPSDEEQLYLEYINRARLNPLAEGYLLATNTTPSVADAYAFFNVDLQRAIDEIALYPPVQPLSFESRLIQAARGHSAYMFTRGLQEHDQTDPLTGAVLNSISQRATAVGYPWNTLGENIYMVAESVLQGHAGFEVDWGYGEGGVQRPPGHRNNNHDPDFREIGVGVLLGTNRVVLHAITNIVGTNIVVTPAATNFIGPQVVTVDFGARPSLPALVTGVAYYDINANGFYDIGEGLPGVRVEAPEGGSFAVTSRSGGYSVPAAEGTNSVRFILDGTVVSTRTAVTTNRENVKRDLILPYVAPAVGGSTNAQVSAPNFYQLAAVPGAQAYEWSVQRLSPFSATEGVEDGGTNFIFDVSPGWNPVKTNFPASGRRSFQLVHTNGADQVLTYRPSLYAGASATIRYKSYFGYTTTNQIGVLEASSDGGATWRLVLGQRGIGAGNQPGTAYITRTASLSAYAGRSVQIRFRFFVEDIPDAFRFPQSTPSFGWHLDDIEFTGFSSIFDASTNSIAAGRSFVFQPPLEGLYELRGRPLIGGRAFPFSASLAVQARVSAPVGGVIAIDAIRRITEGRLALDFSLVSGVAGTWRLQAAPALNGTWTETADAQLSTNSPGRYTFVHTPGDASLFYRIAVQ
jgi:hypothetical protein